MSRNKKKLKHSISRWYLGWDHEHRLYTVCKNGFISLKTDNKDEAIQRRNELNKLDEDEQEFKRMLHRPPSE